MSGPNVLIFVRRKGLIVAGKHVTPARLEFGESLVHHLEVLDRPKFVELCRQFFVSNKLDKRRAIIVLDQDITFEKVIQQDTAENVEAAREAFVAAMPFETGKRACFAVAVDDTTRLCATNYELFYTIAQALEAAGAKLISVTPLTLYGLEPGQQLKDVVNKLLRDASVRKKANFARVSAE